MKTPFVTKDQLEAICQQYPTPFHLYDEAGIRQTAREVNQAFAWNPGFREYFAVKATPTPGILKVLKEEGCGVDCSSLTELIMSDKCGFTGHEIMFSSNETPAEEYVQADKQLADTEIQCMHAGSAGVPTVAEYLTANFTAGETLLLDGSCVPATLAEEYAAALAKSGAALKSQDVASSIWDATGERKPLPDTACELLTPAQTGATAADRIALVRAELEKAGATALAVTGLDCVGWLLNLRAMDIQCTPYAMAYCYVTPDNATLFINTARVSAEAAAELKENGVELAEYDDVLSFLAAQTETQTVLADPASVNYAVYQTLEANPALTVKDEADPLLPMKGVKNEVELAHTREAHLRDGVAMVRFQIELENRLAAGEELTELTIDEILHKYRSEQDKFLTESFGTIAAYGPNAAMMHYHATPEDHAVLEKKGFLLVDSGATYMDGTTAQVDISKMTYVYTSPATPATKTVKSGDVTHSTGINALVMKADDQNKYFYVDTYINTNKVADTNGILNGHLFQFTTKSNGTLDAVEVATGTAAKLYNLADVAVSKNTQVYGGATGTLVVNSNTVFLVRSGADTTANPYTFKSITGFTNIDNYAKGEVDYVDLNGDNVADYVYVIAPTTTSKVTSLFYFDGQQGAYTLADGTWVVKGYVDGVAGEVKFANFDALQNTLKINGQTGYPVNNTLYVVTLEDGVVKSGHIVTDGEQLEGYANYPLSSAYNTYSDITINIVEGAAGTAEENYSDRDTFADSLYHDYSANKYYSVVTDLTKVVGTMGNPADQHYYFVSIQNNGQLNALALQAYAYDKVKSGVDVPNAATVIGVALNANKDATVSLNDKNDAKTGDVYSVTLEQLRDNGYVAVGTFSGTVASDGATSVTIDLRGVIGAGTYKVTAGSYTSIMSFAN